MRKTLTVCMAALLGVATASAATARPVACVVEPRSTTVLSSSVEGLVREVRVGRGDHVQAGDVLVRLDDDLERLQLEMSMARAASDLDVRAQLARVDLRSKEFDRAVELSERNIAAQTVLEDAEIELALTELALEEARFNQTLAQIEVRQARAVLERRQITSPVSGIVTVVDVNEGEFANEQKELLTIVEVEELSVEVFAPAELFGQVSVGDEVPVRLKPPLQVDFTASVELVDEVLDAASATFGIRLRVDNSEGRIPAGARCEVLFGGAL